MSRQQKFEQIWAERHGIPAETLAQYRFDSKEGYSLPGMAAHYRTYCDTLDSLVIELPFYGNYFHESSERESGETYALAAAEFIRDQGLKVAP